MKRSLAFVYVVGLFLLGIVIGGMAMHLHYASRFPPPGSHGPGMRHGEPMHSFSGRLERQLDLTAEQKRQIDEIVALSRTEGSALHEEMLPRVREHMRRTHDRILEVLTPEQRERFEELSSRHRRRAERFFLGH